MKETEGCAQGSREATFHAESSFLRGLNWVYSSSVFFTDSFILTSWECWCFSLNQSLFSLWILSPGTLIHWDSLLQPSTLIGQLTKLSLNPWLLSWIQNYIFIFLVNIFTWVFNWWLKSVHQKENVSVFIPPSPSLFKKSFYVFHIFALE